MYHLSQSVSIEDRSYRGPLLPTDRFPWLSKNKVYNKLADDLPVGSHLFDRDMILLDLMEVLHQARPEISPVPTFLLPHFHTADVEMVHEQESGTWNQAQSASNNLQRAMDKNVLREAVVLHSSNAYQMVRRRDGSTVPMLRQYHAMRVRQLRALGTSVIEVPHFEFEASSDKRRYLLTKFEEEQNRLQNVGPH